MQKLLTKNKSVVQRKFSSKLSRHPHVWQKNGVNGGVPVIKNTRLAVSFIAELERTGNSVDEIVAAYPYISHAQVFDALSYYYDHQKSIESEVTEQEIAMKQLINGHK